MVLGLGGWWDSPYFGEQDGFNNERMNYFANTIKYNRVRLTMCYGEFINIHDLGGFDESLEHTTQL